MTDNQFNQLFDLVTKCVSGIQRLENDVAVLKTDMAEVKSDVSILKSDMAEVKTDVSELKTDVSELKTDVSELKEGQNRIEKQTRLNNAAVNELAGEQLRINSRVTEMEKATV